MYVLDGILIFSLGFVRTFDVRLLKYEP